MKLFGVDSPDDRVRAPRQTVVSHVLAIIVGDPTPVLQRIGIIGHFGTLSATSTLTQDAEDRLHGISYQI